MARAIAAMPRRVALRSKAKIVAAAEISGDAATLEL
jgi:hypothetical protein